MATRIRTRNQTGTVPEAYPQTNGYKDMDTTTFSGSFATLAAQAAENALGERIEGLSAAVDNFGFWSERVAAPVTISGTVTFNIWRTHNAAWLAWMRARLYKITASGSIETLICQADAPQTVGNNTVLNFTGTPATPVAMAVGERFILRISWYPITPSTWGSTTPNVYYGTSTAGSMGDSYVDVTETVTFQPNLSEIYCRRTTASGIGTFYDALPTLGGSAFTTGVVNTVASGTEVQWTRTGGGTLLEWITPRMKHPGWLMSNAANYLRTGVAFASESNLLANCTLRIKLFRRDPAGGETLFYTLSRSVEFGTTRSAQGLNGGTLDSTRTFYEDDRLVIRLYIIPVGTMASGYTCTVAYDNNTQSGSTDGSAYLQFLSFPFLKAESDPSGPSRASDLSLTGVVGG